MPLTRRQFLGRTALAAGATLCPALLLAEPAGLVARTAAARRRFARVAVFINQSHPALRAKIIAAADEAMRGMLLLPGSSGLSSVGSPPDWLTPQHRDEEFLWSLNRMMHWKTLLQAHALTGDERYAVKVAAELDDWIARTQPPSFRHADGRPNPEIGTNAGPPPWRELEVGIRMFDSWPVVFEQLAGTAHLPPERLARLAGSVAQHGESLSLLSPLLWPEADHNHYFMEMLGLLAIGVYFPELKPAWTDQALRELQRCVQKQFTADGGHIEACPTYHNVCVVLLARYLALAEAAGRPLPAEIRALAAASAGQTLHSVRPTGLIVPWGDSTRSNQVEGALWLYRTTGELDVLQHLAGLMGVAQVQAHATPHLWDIDDPAALFAQIGRAPQVQPLVRFDRGNDQVMARTSWHRDALSVFFSCHSPLVPGSGHQHIDLGGFDFTAFGRTLVADPGVFTYREGADRKLFKSAEYHSVLTIDGRSPFEYISRWRYSPQQEGRVTAVHEAPGLVRMDSFHHNYAPAVCRRTLALVDGRLLVVIDSVEDIAPASTVQIYYHLDSLKVTWDQATNLALADDAEVKLALYTSGGFQGELLPGRISESPDTDRPSTRLKLSDEGGPARRVWLTVLAPWRAGEKRPEINDVVVSSDRRRCSFTCGGIEHRLDCQIG
jgi:hypothetical protein